MDKPLSSAVLFLIFNRPETTRLVFAEIRKARPGKLYIAADGPRKDRPGEFENCRAAREVVSQIDWECEVRTLFREENLGCRMAVSSAIDWFFQNVEEGIILEDDCLPDQSFFLFCRELLAKYRNDTRIMHIGGVNYQSGSVTGDGSYYFSRYSHIWGWATWRRAWAHYDVKMKTWPQFLEQNKIAGIFEDRSIQRYWLKRFQETYEGEINTWDYQWVYAIWVQNGFTVIPNVNLVSNIGFGEGATHPAQKSDKHFNMKTGSVSEIIHPSCIIVNKAADARIFKHDFQGTFLSRVRNKIKNIFRKIVKKYD
ncbi:MAG: hypothetical protein NTY10_00990 [Candidatus Omnitrophica bacterium]|nr:hypothetical protein [Candidatus Omnitrophota bacterium]